MKITNKLGLPQPLVDAVSMREPSDSYSASMLMQSPRMVWLKRRHFHKVEKDVSEQIWALFGTAVHGIIEKCETADSIQEAYLSHEIDGVKVTGMADVYEKGKNRVMKQVWFVLILPVDLQDHKKDRPENPLLPYNPALWQHESEIPVALFQVPFQTPPEFPSFYSCNFS